MNTTTPDPATLRALSVTRKQDRVIMRDTIRTICNQPGITAEIREENRSVTARISSDSGLCATFVISPRYPDTVIHWHMHHEAKGTISNRIAWGFTRFNPDHHRKATKICLNFLNICEHLEAAIHSIRNGTAVILPAIEPIHPDKQQPTNTTMQTLQPSPAEVARKATSTRDQITTIAATLRTLFQADNDAPRLFAEQFADVLTQHGWSDPHTSDDDIDEIRELTEERDSIQEDLNKAETRIEALEARIEELEAELDA
jgi:hypothetical protein